MMKYEKLARGPIFSEPLNLHKIECELLDWDSFAAFHYRRIFEMRESWEDTAYQMGRLCGAWKEAGRDQAILDRLFHFMLETATEHPEESQVQMVKLLVKAFGYVPRDPDPPDPDYTSPSVNNEGLDGIGRSISKSLRFRVLERDGFSCRYCGARAPNAVLQCDHVRPVSAGGRTTLDNLVTACSDCNAGKGARYDARSALLARVLFEIDREPK